MSRIPMDWAKCLIIATLLVILGRQTGATTAEQFKGNPPSINWQKGNLYTGQQNKVGELARQAAELKLGIKQPTTVPMHSSGNSPALETLFMKTGEKEYLRADTLKDSISDLAILSDSESDNESENQNCGAKATDSKIIFTHCPGTLVVVTIAGTMKMTCNEIEKRSFYGPVIIKNAVCQQGMVFERKCEDIQNFKYQSSRCEPIKHNTIIIVQAVVIGLLVLIIVIPILWTLKRRAGLKLTNETIPLHRKGCYFTADIIEHTDELGEVVYTKPSTTSFLNERKTTYSISIWKFVLFFLLCRSPRVKAFNIINSYDATLMKYVYRVQMGDSEVIDLGPVTISRSTVIHTAQLSPMFATYDWSLNHHQTYYCQWSSCDASSKCTLAPLPFVPMTDTVQQALGLNSKALSYHSCVRYLGYCNFGNGCGIFGFTVKNQAGSEFQVYSIGSGGSHGGEVTAPPGCILDSIIDKSAGALSNYYLVMKSEEDAYLCHDSLYSFKTEIGLLGDVRKYPDGEQIFAHDGVKCQSDAYGTVYCRYIDSFISQIDKLCHKTSVELLGISIDTRTKMISWRLSGEAEVVLKCDRPLNFPKSNGDCLDKAFHVWEVAHLDSSLLLSFTASSTKHGAMVTLPMSVHAKSHTFPCDGRSHFTELYDLQSLNSSGIKYSHEIMPLERLDEQQKDHFADSDVSQRGVPDIWDNLRNWSPSLTFVALAVLVCFAMACYCRR